MRKALLITSALEVRQWRLTETELPEVSELSRAKLLAGVLGSILPFSLPDHFSPLDALAVLWRSPDTN